MTAKAEKTHKIESPSLKRALLADGGSNRELAERAGISFRAIAEARDGFETAELRGARKRLGVVSSMTRLATCLDVDPSQVLRELGIDISDASVRRQIERAREASLLRPSEEDPVLRAIRARELSGGTPGPVVGIVSWSPFTDDPGGGSFARLLARSVMGSLNPEWDREVNLKPEKNFIDAERRLLSSEPDRPDCVVGLYDLPWRRQGDVEVVPLPGLYVRVGGLCTHPISWNDILANKPGAPLPHVLVIHGDVGDRLLRGPVDYPDGRLIKQRLETFDPAEIATRIQEHLSTDFKDGFLFVADGPLVRAVRAALPNASLHFVDGEDERRWAPVVRFGFAVPHDASRFVALLNDAISGDLLGRALPRTVQLYLRLLDLDLTNQIGFDPADLDRRELGLAARFVEIAKKLDTDAKNILSKAARDKETVEAFFEPRNDRRTVSTN